MQSQTLTPGTVSDKTLFIKMAIGAWDTYNTRVSKLLDTLSDEQLLAPTAPGRNTGIYLIGHLVAISDSLLPLLGVGEKLYPELYKIFVESPDNSGHKFPSLSQLKEYWRAVNAILDAAIRQMPPDEWFTRHNSVSEADFAKEPHRNKLNIILNRTSHTSYHLGQLTYLAKNNRG